MQDIPHENRSENTGVYVVDASEPRNHDFMGRAFGRIIGYVNAVILSKNPNNIRYIYATGSLYPIRVVAELPKEGGFEKLALASAMPGILGDTSVTVELHPENIRRIGIDPATLDQLVATEARGN